MATKWKPAATCFRKRSRINGGALWEIQITTGTANLHRGKLRRASRIPCASGKQCAPWSIKENSSKAARLTATSRLSQASRRASRDIKRAGVAGVVAEGVAVKVVAEVLARIKPASTRRRKTKI